MRRWTFFARPAAGPTLVLLTLAAFRAPLDDLFLKDGHPHPEALSALAIAVVIAAMTVLARLFATGASRLKSLPLPSTRVAFLAPVCGMLGALWGDPTSAPQRELLLWPFVLACFVLAWLGLTRRPSSYAVGELMSVIATTRWFYLGALLATPSLRSSPLPSSQDLIVYLVLFLALHLATRSLRQVDTQRFPEPQGLLAQYDAQSLAIVVELCGVLVASLVLGVQSRLTPSDGLAGYLALLTVNAFLLKWTLEGPRLERGGWAKFLASMARVWTVLVGLCLALALLNPSDAALAPALALLFCLGTVAGRPWGSQPPGARVGSPSLPSLRARPLSPRFGWSLAAALLCLAFAFASWPSPSAACSEPPAVRAKRWLQATQGWRFRLQVLSERDGVISHYQGSRWDLALSPEQVSRAEHVVGGAWPEARLLSEEIQPGPWERLNEALGVMLVLGHLLLAGVLFGRLSPPNPSLFRGLALLGAGAFGGLGLASWWGWVWLNTPLNVLLFVYLAILSASQPLSLQGRRAEASFQLPGRRARPETEF